MSPRHMSTFERLQNAARNRSRIETRAQTPSAARCPMCDGKGKIHPPAIRTWWDKVLRRPETLDRSCPSCRSGSLEKGAVPPTDSQIRTAWETPLEPWTSNGGWRNRPQPLWERWHRLRLKSRNESVRVSAGVALAQSGFPYPLIFLIDDQSAYVREKALSILPSIGHGGLVLDHLLSNAKVGSISNEGVSFLKRVLEGGSPEEKTIAAEALKLREQTSDKDLRFWLQLAAQHKEPHLDGRKLTEFLKQESDDLCRTLLKELEREGTPPAWHYDAIEAFRELGTIFGAKQLVAYLQMRPRTLSADTLVEALVTIPREAAHVLCRSAHFGDVEVAAAVYRVLETGAPRIDLDDLGRIAGATFPDVYVDTGHGFGYTLNGGRISGLAATEMRKR